MKVRKRLPLILAFLTLIMILVVAADAFLRPRELDTVTPDNFSRIQVGMSYDEVDAIFAVPSGYTPPSPWREPLPKPLYLITTARGIPINDMTEEGRRTWMGTRYIVDVALDDTGKVVGCYLSEDVSLPQTPTILERVRKWLGI